MTNLNQYLSPMLELTEVVNELGFAYSGIGEDYEFEAW